MTQLIIPEEDAFGRLQKVEHSRFQDALRTYWKVRNGNQVPDKSMAWLYCWGMTGMNKKHTQDEVRRLFSELFGFTFDSYATQHDHEEARAIRYQDEQVQDEEIIDLLADSLNSDNEEHQGFQSSVEIRKVIENFSMEKAVQYYKAKGHIDIKDTSKGNPYDLMIDGKSENLHVEVKGLQSSGETVILTRREVEHARKHERTKLFIVHDIKVELEGKTYVAKDGIVEELDLRIEDSQLRPIAFYYSVKKTGRRT